MVRQPPRRASAGPYLVLMSVVLVACALASVARADGIPVTVVTLKGESIAGRFVGATSAEVTIETPSRILDLLLQDVSYISFSGRPPSADAVSYSPSTTPSSQLRAEGLTSETVGRLDEALRKYQESERLAPSDLLTARALERVRRKIQAREG